MAQLTQTKPPLYPEQRAMGVFCLLWIAAYAFCLFAPLGSNKNPDASFGLFDALSAVIFTSSLALLAGIVASLIRKVGSRPGTMLAVSICGIIATLWCFVSLGASSIDCSAGEVCAGTASSSMQIILSAIVFVIWVPVPFIISRLFKARLS
ncbi:MAG TPA: hypothetical protein VN778_02725 [Verrucomicrobiae bacterium]|nr:hypothetical protein [Verrucomicrobiae bacterium]